MPRDALESVRKRYGRQQPPGVVLILLIATFSIGTLLICAQIARMAYATGIAGDIRSRLQADYRPWTPQAFAPVSTAISVGTPEPLRGSPSILEPIATQTCSASGAACESGDPSSPGSATPAPPAGDVPMSETPAGAPGQGDDPSG